MWRKPCRSASRTTTWWWRREGGHEGGLKRSRSHGLSACPCSGVTILWRHPRACPIGAKISACPGRCAAWSMKGVYARLRGLWRNDALQTPISGLPEIGAQMHAGRVNPTCMDRYTHCLRDGPGPAVHRLAIARAAPHPGHVRPYLSAYRTLARRFGRHGNANLVEIRIIPTCIRLWLQRLSRPRLATSACRGQWPNDRWRTRQVG